MLKPQEYKRELGPAPLAVFAYRSVPQESAGTIPMMPEREISMPMGLTTGAAPQQVYEGMDNAEQLRKRIQAANWQSPQHSKRIQDFDKITSESHENTQRKHSFNAMTAALPFGFPHRLHLVDARKTRHIRDHNLHETDKPTLSKHFQGHIQKAPPQPPIFCKHLQVHIQKAPPNHFSQAPLSSLRYIW